jgi:hypothetical protein
MKLSECGSISSSPIPSALLSSILLDQERTVNLSDTLISFDRNHSLTLTSNRRMTNISLLPCIFIPALAITPSLAGVAYLFAPSSLPLYIACMRDSPADSTLYSTILTSTRDDIDNSSTKEHIFSLWPANTR